MHEGEGGRRGGSERRRGEDEVQALASIVESLVLTFGWFCGMFPK